MIAQMRYKSVSNALSAKNGDRKPPVPISPVKKD